MELVQRRLDPIRRRIGDGSQQMPGAVDAVTDRDGPRTGFVGGERFTNPSAGAAGVRRGAGHAGRHRAVPDTEGDALEGRCQS